MRMLMMFGPMIFRQFQKYQRNKANKQLTQTSEVDREETVREELHG